ncbi:MAG: helix-turn-helix transcriptional regulator [Chloroflexia bacterium]
MITNERQSVSRPAAYEQGAHLHPRLQQAMRESQESQLQELREQLAEYEALRSGRVAVLELASLGEAPDALIRARIAAGLTQRELAKRLGIKEQQVQRYEATRYAGASMERIQRVAEALGAKIQARVVLPTAPEEDAEKPTARTSPTTET